METKDKLKLAYDIASVFDNVPDDSETSQEEYQLYIEKLIGDDVEEPTLEEFITVLLDYGGLDTYDVNYEIRKEYFNS